MAFKEANLSFKKEGKFIDTARRFASDEVSKFSKENASDASADFDMAFSKAFSYSAEKDKTEARALKQDIKDYEKAEKIFKESGFERISPEDGREDSSDGAHGTKKEARAASKSAERRTDTKEAGEKAREPISPGKGQIRAIQGEGIFSSGAASSPKARAAAEIREKAKKALGSSTSGPKFIERGEAAASSFPLGQDAIRLERRALSKKRKSAAKKSAAAKALRAKGMIGNDLSDDSATGDAMRDGNRGLVKVFTEAINPMTYVKKAVSEAVLKLAGLIAPHILTVLAGMMVVMVLFAFTGGMMNVVGAVVDTVTGFIANFTSTEKIFTENVLSEDEIDEIVADSGAEGEEATTIRFALSKVGMPYSQAKRTSGAAYDCSSLAYYSWLNSGVDLSFGTGYPPTAASMAYQLYSRHMVVDTSGTDTSVMRPGDLIFYGNSDNGRFLGIYHVAIYVGNGKVAEAYNEKHGLVYSSVRSKNAVLVARPAA